MKTYQYFLAITFVSMVALYGIIFNFPATNPIAYRTALGLGIVATVSAITALITVLRFK